MPSMNTLALWVGIILLVWVTGEIFDGWWKAAALFFGIGLAIEGTMGRHEDRHHS